MANGSGLLIRAPKGARGFESHHLRLFRWDVPNWLRSRSCQPEADPPWAEKPVPD